MKLYLIRHGDAKEDFIDAERPLSTKGVLQVKRLAHHLRESAAKPKHIYHSGMLRAWQTAEIIASVLGCAHSEKIAQLESGDAIKPIQHKIENWLEDTILVGHMPYMKDLLTQLTEGKESIGFHTATGVCLEKQDECWAIKWVFHGGDN